jgi:hypothetical protein
MPISDLSFFIFNQEEKVWALYRGHEVTEKNELT